MKNFHNTNQPYNNDYANSLFRDRDIFIIKDGVFAEIRNNKQACRCLRIGENTKE